MVKKKQNTRAKRGSVSVWTRSGMLRLRWRYQGDRFELTLGLRDTPFNRTIAEKQAKEIEVAMAIGAFDPSLAKYKPQKVEPEAEPQALSVVGIYDLYTEYQREKGLQGVTLHNRNKSMRSRLSQFGGDITSEKEASDFLLFLRKFQAPQTIDENLSKLKTFGKWAVRYGHWDKNHFEPLERRRLSKTTKSNRHPTTTQELDLLLLTARETPRFRVYYPFLTFLFYTGCRPSEAIGLRWRDINWQKREIAMRSSLGRSDDGKSSAGHRKRKPIKNQKIRDIEIHDDLYAVLSEKFTAGCKPDDLVFKTSTGITIDDRVFTRDTMRDLCEAAGIERRVTYATRHTLASFLLEKGWTIVQVAKLLGNRPETLARYYAHQIEQPKLPSYGLHPNCTQTDTQS